MNSDPRNLTIRELDLSARCQYFLAREGLTTVDEILKLPVEQLRAVPYLGRKCFDEIWDTLVALGFQDSRPTHPPDLPDTMIEVLQLEQRFLGWLIVNGMDTVGRLLATPPDDLLYFISFRDWKLIRDRLVVLGYMEPGGLALE